MTQWVRLHSAVVARVPVAVAARGTAATVATPTRGTVVTQDPAPPGVAWLNVRVSGGRDAAASRHATAARAPLRHPSALPALESAPRSLLAPLYRGSLCRRYLQSARENEITLVQRERK